MKRILFLLSIACSVSALAAEPAAAVAADAGIPPAVAAGKDGAVPGANAPPGAVDEEYHIGANDLLEVSVFQVKELDRTVRVNSHGLISLSLIGSLQAAGLSATELEAKIADKLRDRYLQDPQVSVFIKEFTSQRVTVEGQVEKPGIFPMTGPTTLLQSVALAGGIKEVGETATVRVFRLDKGGTRQMLVYDLDRIHDGSIVDPLVRNNDIVVVGKSQSKATIKMITDTLRGFVTFGAL